MIKKRIRYIIFAGALSITFCASGCGKKAVDDQKTEHITETQGETTVDEGEIVEIDNLAGRLEIPDSCNISIDTGTSDFENIQIIDDKIDIPYTNDMSVVYLQTVKTDNSYKQKIAEAIFDAGQDIYCCDQRIKDQVEQDLELAKEEYEDRLAQGLDVSDSELHIEQLEAELLKVSEEYPLAGDYQGNSFCGVIDGKDYTLSFYNHFDGSDGISAYLFGPYGDTEYLYFEGPPIDEMTETNLCEMTPDDASDAAEKIKEQCGITGMEQSDILALEWRTIDYSETENNTDIEYNGYVVKYTKEINGTQVYQGKLDNVKNLGLDNVDFDIPTEDFTVYVNDNGLIQVHWKMIFSETGKEDPSVKLLTWDEVLDAFSSHLPEYYAKYPTDDKSIVFNDVRLTYYPVTDENEENGYKFIPVWVFAECEDYSGTKDPLQLIIINAMDGSIIDLPEQAEKMGFYKE